MEAQFEKLYSELRKTREELQDKLKDENGSKLIKPIIKAELMDIETAIEKIVNGTYGRCEISGELIPFDLLQSFPTAKTVNDFQALQKYYRKPFWS
ncbi:hypothetical protein ACE38V_07025 [Cytobacillus sp. Hz8]|uniref:hypothetical protein n=1 Tax=Cytobacillus sp. Hz8 TaxID=3347168 RepID=UPI0035D6C37C